MDVHHIWYMTLYPVATLIAIFNVLFLSQAIKFKTISCYINQWVTVIKRELDRKFNGRIDAPNLYDNQETMPDQFICSTLSSVCWRLPFPETRMQVSNFSHVNLGVYMMLFFHYRHVYGLWFFVCWPEWAAMSYCDEWHCVVFQISFICCDLLQCSFVWVLLLVTCFLYVLWFLLWLLIHLYLSTSFKQDCGWGLRKLQA